MRKPRGLTMANFNLPTAILTHYKHVGFLSQPLRKDILRGCISICAGLLIWEMLARLLLENELLIPPPSSVLRSFWRLAVSGQLNKHFAATLIEFTYGFATATIVGIIVGYLMGMHRWFDEIMDPWIATLYSIPIITVVPLIIIWFGIGMLDMLADKMPQAKTAKPEQFVDLSFLQELEKENFFNEMAKRYPTK